MQSFFLNLGPVKSGQPAASRLYLVMALVFLGLGGYGVYRAYTEGQRVLAEYMLPLIQIGIAVAYLFISFQKGKATGGKKYVQVTEDHLELKLVANQAPFTLLWSAISLLRVQHDRIIYRLNSGHTGEVLFDTIPEEHEDAVLNAIREAGRKKGVSV